MDEFPGLLARDFGVRPQGKAAPMSAAKSSPAAPSRSRSARAAADPADRAPPPSYDDVFGGPPRYPSTAAASSSPPAFDFDGFTDPGPKPKHSSMPVFDKPVYDDDIFVGVPGIKSSASGKYDDVFATMSGAGAGAGAPRKSAGSPPFDDLLGSLGRGMPAGKGPGGRRSAETKGREVSGFEDLLPGFGRKSSPQQRAPRETKQQSAASSATTTTDDPFAVFTTASTSARPSSGLRTDPSEQITRSVNSGSAKEDASPYSGGFFDDGPSKSIPVFASNTSDNPKNKGSLKTEEKTSHRTSTETFENLTPNMHHTRSSNSLNNIGRNGILNPDVSASPYERNGTTAQSPRSYAHLGTSDDAWLTVAEIPLFTQPTSAPPPSRLPPTFVRRAPLGKFDQFSSLGVNSKVKETDFTSQSNPFSQHTQNSTEKLDLSPLDELDDFASGRSQRYAYENVEVPTSEEEIEKNSAAAAMKEAMDRAEVKFKHAREAREREKDVKSAKNRESQQERYERVMVDSPNPEEDEEKQEGLDLESEQRDMEEKKRREKEREELDRQKGRQAMERATREARERAAAEARLKAERAAVEKASAEARQRAERAAFQKAQAEARERAAAEARGKSERERAAAEAREKERVAAEEREKERAAAEAREKDRVAAEAREKERAAAEAREKERSVSRDRAAVERAAQEARLRAQRAAVEKVATEARERAAAEAQRKAAAAAAAAAAARENQQKMENDLESFFNVGVRPSSAPKQRNPASEAGFGAQFQNKGFTGGIQRTSPSSSATMRKTHSTTNITDDLASIFGASTSSGDFQEVEGESEERRRARLERHQRTLERAAKALAEKNERDMQAHRDQAERHSFGETLDFEIKRWSAGKEGNLRALLSTMQYVLWPECGWQPVSLTDLITGASVKKVYRKATLCIHPDKVQQKGATLQQKYIAEKVFDLLKEAWNKFNSEELF